MSAESKKVTSARSSHVRNMVYIALGAVLMAVCSWITIPSAIPVTLQTMGVFLVCGLLGGRRGTISVLVYLLLGLVGIPVFAGFTAGPGRLFGITGGYLIGFLFSALVMWLLEKLMGRGMWQLALAMVAGLFVCYAFGSAWFYVLSLKSGGKSMLAVLQMCVFPFIIPDSIKIAGALVIIGILRKAMPGKFSE